MPPPLMRHPNSVGALSGLTTEVFLGPALLVIEILDLVQRQVVGGVPGKRRRDDVVIGRVEF
jgi:hypothetical protein